MALEGVEIINNYRPDIVFLDISMPVLNGFEVLENIEYQGFDLVFTTAHQEFGLRALKSNAKDYLLKPVDIDDLKSAIKKIKERREALNQGAEIKKQLLEFLKSQNQKVPLNKKESIEYVTPSQLLCVEANSNHSIITFVDNDNLQVSKSLKEYEILLCKDSNQFMRINHSCIINLKYIQKYIKEDGGYVIMKGGKKISISKTKLKEFLAFIKLKE